MAADTTYPVTKVSFQGVKDTSGNELEGFYKTTLGGETLMFMCTDTGHAPPAPNTIHYHLADVSGAHKLSYLFWKYGDTSDSNRMAALNYIARNSDEINHHHLKPSDRSWSATSMAAARTMVNAMQSEAAALAGPYTLNIRLVPSTNPNYAHDVDVKFKVVSAAGNPVAGIPVTLTLDSRSAATFHENRQKTITINTAANGETSRVIQPSAAGKIKVEGLAAGLPDGTVKMVLPANSTPDSHDSKYNYQRGVTNYYRTTTKPGDAEMDHEPFEVAVTTTTQHTDTTSGANIADKQTITVTKGEWQPGATVTVKSTLWGPMDSKPTESANPPAGTPRVGEVSYTASKAGTYTTDSLAVTKPGYYTWTASIPEGSFNKAYSSRFGEAAETSLVPWEVKVATEVQKDVVSAGDSMADKINLSDGQPGVTYDVVSTLWGPMDTKPAVGKPVPSSAPKVATVTTKIKAGNDGKGSGTSPKTVLPKSGYYVYTETIAATATTKGWVGDKVLASETALGKWEVKVATEVQRPVVSTGDAVADKIALSDAQPGQTYDVVSTLWGPMDTGPLVGEPVPDGTPALDVVTTRITAGKDGTGSGVSPETVLRQPGYYVYTETITGVATSHDWVGDLVLAEETTIAKWRPEITTEASQDIVAAGDTVSDRLTATGFPPAYDVPVEVALYFSPHGWDVTAPDGTEPGDEDTAATDENGDDANGDSDEDPSGNTAGGDEGVDSDVSQEPAVPSGPPEYAELLGTWTVIVSGDGQYETPEFEVPDTPGVFTYFATVADSDLVESFAPVFPELEETFLLPYSPQVTTVAQLDDTSEAGAVVTDLFDVSGGEPGSTLDVVSTLWGPFLDAPPLIERPGGNNGGVDAACEAHVTAGESGAASVATVTTTVVLDETGAASAVTEPVEISEPGFYVWTETIAGTSLSRCWASDFGIPDETVLKQWQPQVATVASSGEAQLGESVFDRVTISGLPANHRSAPAQWQIADDGTASTPVETRDSLPALFTAKLPVDHPSDAGAVTVTLWGPFDSEPEAGLPVPEDAPQVGTTRLAAVNGTQDTDLIGPLDEPGWYVFTVAWPDSLRVAGGQTPAETTEMVWVAEEEIEEEVEEDTMKVDDHGEGIVVQDSTTGFDASSGGGLARTGTPAWMLPAGLLALLAIGGGVAMMYSSGQTRQRAQLRSW